MNTHRFFLAPIKAYQFVSRMLPGSCRYYPTCSEYAAWQFTLNAPHRALIASTLRIARCNPLFPGGIDYPVIRFTPPKCPSACLSKKRHGTIKIVFWIVPTLHNPAHYYIIKDIHDIHLAFPA